MRVSKVIFYREAEADIANIVRYMIQENRRPVQIQRFLNAIDDRCELLTHMPDIGSTRIFQSPKLRDVRIFPLKKFEKYLIFYRVRGTTMEIIRIIHGARDYPSLFE